MHSFCFWLAKSVELDGVIDVMKANGRLWRESPQKHPFACFGNWPAVSPSELVAYIGNKDVPSEVSATNPMSSPVGLVTDVTADVVAGNDGSVTA